MTDFKVTLTKVSQTKFLIPLSIWTSQVHNQVLYIYMYIYTVYMSLEHVWSSIEDKKNMVQVISILTILIMEVHMPYLNKTGLNYYASFFLCTVQEYFWRLRGYVIIFLKPQSFPGI